MVVILFDAICAAIFPDSNAKVFIIGNDREHTIAKSSFIGYYLAVFQSKKQFIDKIANQ